MAGRKLLAQFPGGLGIEVACHLKHDFDELSSYSPQHYFAEASFLLTNLRIAVLEQSPSLTVETLAGFTSPELIIPELSAHSASAVICELGAALLSQGCLKDLTSFEQAVLARESISPTAFVSGWALPHARLPAIPELKFAFGRTRQPVSWFGNPTAQVRTILLFAVPDDAAKAYLNLNAAVARLTQNVPLLERLRTAPDASTTLSILNQVRLPYAQLGAGNRANPPVLAPNPTKLEVGKRSRL